MPKTKEMWSAPQKLKAQGMNGKENPKSWKELVVMDETPASSAASRLHSAVILHVALHVFRQFLQEKYKQDCAIVPMFNSPKSTHVLGVKAHFW